MSATSKLGSLVRRLRKEKKLTQAQVAEMSGLARVHIANLETGKRGGGRIGWETVNGLAKAFGISPDEFARMLEAEKPKSQAVLRGRPKKEPADTPLAAEAKPEAEVKPVKKRNKGGA
jgi:transcriptional regulator with XRE-family HTH domain